jgi:hypothetical protein
MPSVRVRIWNDINPYKEVFVAQGFYELLCQEQLELELVDYAYFQSRGAPPPQGLPYRSHKNIVVMEITVRDKTAHVIYDINDLYYKIPNRLLAWSDLYFKASYQPHYLKTGEPLSGVFWNSLTFRQECLPEPLDTSEAHKILPCSSAMVLSPSLRWNQQYIRGMTGLWHRTPVAEKRYDVFFLGRYWGDTKEATRALLQGVDRHNLRLRGGVVEAYTKVPAMLKRHRHRAVSLGQWAKMCSEARWAAVTRGLDGCVSFKVLHILMVGAPFVAMQLQANLWQPLLADRHYFCIEDDFSDLGEVSERCDEETLMAMGRANLKHWQEYISPEATARHIIAEVLKAL